MKFLSNWRGWAVVILGIGVALFAISIGISSVSKTIQMPDKSQLPHPFGWDL